VDANADRDTGFAAALGDRFANDVECTRHRCACRWEYDIEAVALSANLSAPITSYRASDNGAKPIEQAGAGNGAALLEIRGVTAEIREQETARQRLRHASEFSHAVWRENEAPRPG
jgi:hypothetical protein